MAVGTVLIVEDETQLAGLLQDILEAAGYGVAFAAASKAVAVAESIAPVAVVLDYMMPGLNGTEVVHQMRRELSRSMPPVVLVSGLSNVRELAAEMGADAYLRKPFDVDRFVQTIAAVTTP